MLRWRFYTYVSPTGRMEVQSDVDDFNDEAQERFRASVRYGAVEPQQNWNEPHAKRLKLYTDIYELRFKANRKQVRPLGFFGPSPGKFTILVIAEHKQNVYSPAKAIETADRRRKEILDGKAGIAPLQIDGENYPPDDGEA